jgi:excisionase family DNA binding protein
LLDIDKYVTVQEFHALLGGRLYKDTLYRMIRRGDLPHVRLGSRILIPRDALDRLMEQHND